MGANASTAVKRWVSGDEAKDGKIHEPPAKRPATSSTRFNSKSASIFVYTTKGTMFRDEDGDLAHEFYIEVPATRKGGKARMKRITKGLKPQGEVKLTVPSLNADLPFVLYEDPES